MALLPIILLGAAAGAYALFSTPNKKSGATTTTPGTPGTPVLVPANTLPVPPGGTPADQMPGGPPTVIVTPPGGAVPSAQATPTPQQVLTQALPQLVAQLPQMVTPQATPEVKTIPAPGAVSVPAQTAPTPMQAPTPATPVQTPAQVLTQSLPQVVTNVLTQAATAISPATPLQQTETSPQLDPNGTVALAKLLIDRESSSSWKSANQADVKAWQQKTGLTADGKFGEKSALRMAQEVGVLPLVRYWPASSTQSKEVPSYRAQLNSYAAQVQSTNQAHAVALRNAAAYEVGLAYQANPAAVPVSARQGQADLLAQVLKQ